MDNSTIEQVPHFYFIFSSLDNGNWGSCLWKVFGRTLSVHVLNSCDDAATKASKASENDPTEEEASGAADKSIVKLTKAERRAKLKKSKKEAKKQGKEAEPEVEQTPQEAVLVSSDWTSYSSVLLLSFTFSILYYLCIT